jgi:hypothetical protein
MFVLMSNVESTMIGNSSDNTEIGRWPMSQQGMGQMNNGESVAGGSSLGGAESQIGSTSHDGIRARANNSELTDGNNVVKEDWQDVVIECIKNHSHTRDMKI